LVDSEIEGSTEAVLNRLREADASSVLQSYARIFLRRLPLDLLDSLGVDAARRLVEDTFAFVDSAPAGPSHVRAFVPTIERNGYERPVTVIEILSPDMSFLVDSVTNELQLLGYSVDAVFHPVIGTVRDAAGRLVDVVPARAAEARESFQHYELSASLSGEEMEGLERRLTAVLGDVRKAVDDFRPMQQAVHRMIDLAKAGTSAYPAATVDEAIAFLEWLLEDNFVFLGYREYAIAPGDEGDVISAVPGSGLGILRGTATSRFAEPVLISTLSPRLRARYEEGRLLVISKSNTESRVHRRVRMDYVGIRHMSSDGRVIGEARMLGLFTSKAYMAPADTLPELRSKLAEIFDAEDTIVGSHYYKELVQLFNSFPKDELFATPTEGIRMSLVGLVRLQEREQVKVFVRPDLLRRSVSVLVVVPRDRFNGERRMEIQEIVRQEYGGASVDYRLSLGETGTARMHFTVWVDERVPEVPLAQLENRVVAVTRTWDEIMVERMSAHRGRAAAKRLVEAWSPCLPEYYKSSTHLDVAIGDLARLEELASTGEAVVVGVQHEDRNGESLSRLTIYRSETRLELSSVMPILEDLGLRVVEEVPTRVQDGEETIFIHDFGVLDPEGAPIEVDRCGSRVAATVRSALTGASESDSLNRLIVNSRLTHDQVTVLRAYRTYWQRVGSGFTQAYINGTFARHPLIAELITDLFEARFDASGAGWEREVDLVDELQDRLDAVDSLDEDRILRGFLGLVLATLRTNVHVPGRRSLSFKFDSARVPGMPAPAPFTEVFVYAPDVEGIHLRGGRVARGGIRWSVRKEDYRTEVLGLMKAQMTKNAVIVPTGSKGGFVLRGTSADAPTPEGVRQAYSTFIAGLLDVTDNLVAGRVIHPPDVVVHDGGDPYLVVAADKGTATFSDLANEIAAGYGYWLGDAFASGGSAGYDHKALGITARGVWESVNWHLRELGIDPEHQAFSVVGVGDMSGDVFGNGMLLSNKVKLVAAFDHRHVFIDPDPDPAASHAERKRLFELPRSSWADYDRDQISHGGGVWPRTAKRIDLSPEARAALGIDAVALTPSEAIKAILRAPVTLLWNGGIGTYVKASTEGNDEADDRANDPVRIDASELRCRVVGEGGNLGFTQLGRVEYAGRGGRIYTDFIDNSGGVNCSDREVNLKILLGLAEEAGELTREARDEVVAAVADDVVAKILYDNFLQAQILAQEVAAAPWRIEAHEDLMHQLEMQGLLSRSIERLPSTDEMSDRSRSGAGLTAPELAVLLAYAKRVLRDQLVVSDLTAADDFDEELASYFPEAVVELFGHLLERHPLRRELIATMVANEVVNSEGITFVSRLATEAGARPDQVVTAYRVARRVTGAEERWSAVESLVGVIAPETERELLTGIDELAETVARWNLAHMGNIPTRQVVAGAKPSFDELAAIIGTIGPSAWREERQGEIARLEALGVPSHVAAAHAYLEDLVHAPAIIEVADRTGHSLRDVAEVFLLVGPAFEIDWLEKQLDSLPSASRWHRQAAQAMGDELAALRRQLAERILESARGATPEAAVDSYLVDRTAGVAQLTRFAQALAADGVDDVATVLVAMKHIRNLLR